MAGRCGEVAARLRAGLNLLCCSRWLPSLGASGARSAHAGAAAQLHREYDAVVIGAGNRARERESSRGEPHLSCPQGR